MSQNLEHITTSTKAEAQHAARQIRADGYSNVQVSRKPGTGRGKNAWWRVTSSGPKRSDYAVGKSNARKNPTRLQKLMASTKAAKKRRVAKALRAYMKTENPGTPLKGVVVQKLKGGVIKLTPVKMNRGRK